jgi:Protein of unknown function (DUF2877)
VTPASRIVPAACDVALYPLLTGPAVPARVVVATRSAAYAQLPVLDADASRRPAPVVAILTPSAVRVPAGLLPATDAVALVTGLRPGQEVVLGGGAVVTGGVRLGPLRWWDSRVPRVPLASVPPLDLPPLPDAVLRGARALEQALIEGDAGHHVGHAVAALVGLGPGLTPAGDDVLAGALVAMSVVGDRARREALAAAVRSRLTRTTIVSAAFLEHAGAGRAVPQLARFVAGLAGGRVVGGVVQDLLRVGATSGVALGWGAVIGLRAAAAAALPTSLEVA